MVSSTLLSFQSVKPHSSVAVDLDGPGRQQDFRGERLSILETNEEDEEEDVDIFETFDEFPTGDLPTFAKGGPGGLGEEDAAGAQKRQLRRTASSSKLRLGTRSMTRKGTGPSGDPLCITSKMPHPKVLPDLIDSSFA